MELLSAVVLAFCLAVIGIRLQIRWACKLGIFDRPKKHSIHADSIPSGGGMSLLLAIFAGVVIAAFFTQDASLLKPMPALCLVAFISLLDDFRSQRVPVRLAVHIGAAVLAVYIGRPVDALPVFGGITFGSDILAWMVSVCWIVLVCNLYYFMDGVDGFAGLQGALSGAILVVLVESPIIQIWGGCLSAACLAFLIFNWMPAKIFMGDVGSISIGFCVASLPFHGPVESSGATLILVALSLWFFLLDGLSTLIRRMLAGEKPWKSHNDHLYQRWVRDGLSHAGACFRVHGVTLVMFCAIGGLQMGALRRLDYTLVLVVTIGVFVALSWRFRRIPNQS